MSKKPSAIVPSGKVYYIDHVKVLLTILVILHHTFITYGAPGSWYYRQPTTNLAFVIPMTWFVATNQSFFMGMFFLLSSYFIEPSYNRKGAKLFLSDRLKRLGIPLLFYSFVLSPIMTFLVYRWGEHHSITFFQYLGGFDDWIDFGVLWFVAALLLFNFLFIIYKKAPASKKKLVSLPSPAAVFLFSVALGIISFFVRIIFPVGWTWHPVGFQLAYFTQYIALFYIGIAAMRNDWLGQLSNVYAKRFGWLSLLMVVVIFPCVFLLKEIFNVPLENFFGGWHWESFVNSLWEQITGVSIIVFLLSFAKLRWNDSFPLLSRLSRCAFAVYIFHPLFVISFSLLLSGLDWDPVSKLCIVAPAAVMASFLFASLLVRIKGVNQVI